VGAEFLTLSAYMTRPLTSRHSVGPSPDMRCPHYGDVAGSLNIGNRSISRRHVPFHAGMRGGRETAAERFPACSMLLAAAAMEPRRLNS